ncbi:hypothetical protein AVEN_227145-1 [Araneus ventricosus]|uniref:Uncharacterized protein n=1 Tax=Araneus ventricosus TaxID=182803 RepID=A0A4Y2BUN1_ARAVE|nr:hypothetical protein AVEN_227145-1 [Araneus ventricosus]
MTSVRSGFDHTDDITFQQSLPLAELWPALILICSLAVIDYLLDLGYGPSLTVKRAIINPGKRLIRMKRRLGSTSGAKTSSPKGAHPPARRRL